MKLFNIYNLLRIHQLIKSEKIKLIGLLFFNLFGFRHLSIRLDPVLACNLRCRMCYFSDEKERKNLNGKLSEEELRSLARIFYSKALQVVVGCGAEPTVYNNFIQIIKDAKYYKVPNVSLVTNGMLLNKSDFEQFAELKLDEFILSMHGVKKDTYEYFMVNADYSKFIENLETLKKIRRSSEHPKVRINYTVNDKNLDELYSFFKTFGEYPIDIIQLRPVREIGGKYSNSIKDEQIDSYNRIINLFKEESHKRGIQLLANTIDIKYEKPNKSSTVIEAIYTYLGPKTAQETGLDWTNTSFRKYMKKISWRKNIINSIFGIKKNSGKKDDLLKYEILS